ILLFIWIETSNEYFNFDWVVYLGTGQWIFWSIFVLSLAGILTAYSSLLLLLGFLLLWEGIELYLHWCHKILILLVILLCILFMFILCKFWSERWLVAGLSLQIFAPYVHLCSVTLMVILSWPLAFYVAHLEREVRMRRHRMTRSEKKRLKRCNILTRLRGLQVAVGLPFLLILLCLYLMPLGIYSPCIQEKEDLGPKPAFFGHRGAPMVGPENTMMSFEKAIEQGAYGLETDIYLRDYKAANIKINLYIVNEPWLFSLAWCSRINSVTTDNIPLLSQINHPYFFMTPRFYMFMWLLMDIVSAIFIFAIFCFHWRREIKKEKLFKASAILTDTNSTSQSEKQ
ncbi:glycerophosphodiester phosphodiesterase domain-containing protein 4, partial [Daubentonia madagascariensis]